MKKKAQLQFLTIPSLLVLGGILIFGLIFLGGFLWLVNINFELILRLIGGAMLIGVGYTTLIKQKKLERWI